LTEGDRDVFVSRTDAEEWEHDAETGGLVHLLRADDDVQAGLWKPGDVTGKRIDVELVADETLLVLAGTGELRVDGGAPLPLPARRHGLPPQGSADKLGRGRRVQRVLGLQRAGVSRGGPRLH
jgi:uncharacterized cupin superfamily protein